MLGLAAACENLDDDHAASAARAWPRQHPRFVDHCFGRLGFFCGRRHGEQLASVGNVCGAVEAGEQPIMSDAVEAFRQHVDQEAWDELVGRQRHGLVAGRPFDPIILVLEGDALLVGGHQPAIGDRDAVGVARQIACQGTAARTAKLMVFKLVFAAAKTWRRLKGENQLPKIVRGVRFQNGVEVIEMPANHAA